MKRPAAAPNQRIVSSSPAGPTRQGFEGQVVAGRPQKEFEGVGALMPRLTQNPVRRMGIPAVLTELEAASGRLKVRPVV